MVCYEETSEVALTTTKVRVMMHHHPQNGLYEVRGVCYRKVQ